MPLGEASGEGSGPQGFSRGRGLHTAALKATKNEEDVIFFCDVDVVMEVEFLQRCRANVVYRRQVCGVVVVLLWCGGDGGSGSGVSVSLYVLLFLKLLKIILKPSKSPLKIFKTPLKKTQNP